MIKSSFITTPYRNNQVIPLTGITSLAVYNSGNCTVIINGKPIYPAQKEILVVPDGTYSDVTLNVEFIEFEIKIPKKQAVVLPSPRQIDPTVQPKYNYNKSILLIYKKIS
ncbi:MAG: hypothetical protein K2P85_01895 [Flavobacteriaceae bacterium]|nr:hypothetical protein [Flavobacteriaceae bacterium]